MEEIWTEIYWPHETDGPWTVKLGWDVIDGRWEAVALEVSPHPSVPLAPLRAVDMRTLRLGEIVERSRPELQQEVDHRLRVASGPGIMQRWRRTMAENPWSDAERVEELQRMAENEPLVQEAARLREDLDEVTPPRAKPGRPPLSRHHLEEVARIYREAHINGDPPTKAVADKFYVGRSTAAKWVAKCRDAGLLGKTKQGRAGGITPSQPKENS